MQPAMVKQARTRKDTRTSRWAAAATAASPAVIVPRASSARTAASSAYSVAVSPRARSASADTTARRDSAAWRASSAAAACVCSEVLEREEEM